LPNNGTKVNTAAFNAPEMTLAAVKGPTREGGD
jgi:hypothetical protein